MNEPRVSQVSDALVDLLPRASSAAVLRADSTPVPGSAADLERSREWAAVRRQEYLAGRWCARVALNRAGYAGPPAALGADADGLPQWPDGFLGSITHSRGLCAALQRARGAGFTGVDVERTDRMRGGHGARSASGGSRFCGDDPVRQRCCSASRKVYKA